MIRGFVGCAVRSHETASAGAEAPTLATTHANPNAIRRVIWTALLEAYPVLDNDLAKPSRNVTSLLAPRFGRAAGPKVIRDGHAIAAEQRLHQDLVALRRDSIRHARRRDPPEVLENRFRSNGADPAAHRPHAAGSVPARDPESSARLHRLRDRHAWHGLVGHQAGRELHRAGAAPSD